MHAFLWHLELQMLSSCPPGSSWCCWALPPSPSQTHLHWRTRSPPSDTLWSASSSDPESRWGEYPAHPLNWEKQAENNDLSVSQSDRHLLSRALHRATLTLYNLTLVDVVHICLFTCETLHTRDIQINVFFDVPALGSFLVTWLFNLIWIIIIFSIHFSE